MNERILRPGNVAAGAVTIGGLLVVLMPHYALTVAQLVVVTVAAAAVLHALVVAVPEWGEGGGWESPFRHAPGGGGERSRAEETERIRWKLSGRRQRIAGGPPLPPETLYLLQPLIRSALEREGVDPDDEAGVEAARRLLAPLTRAVLGAEPIQRPHWWFATLRPDPHRVAGAVHSVLDDLDRVAAGTGRGRPRPAALQPGAP